jgi:hypothetical protein
MYSKTTRSTTACVTSIGVMHERDVDPTAGEPLSVQGIPDDARRLGLDRYTEEGALVAMAGSLTSSKPAHRLVAWIALIAFVAPLLLAMLGAIL